MYGAPSRYSVPSRLGGVRNKEARGLSTLFEQLNNPYQGNSHSKKDEQEP